MFQTFTETEPSPAALAQLLRNPKAWPESFGPWDYTHSDSCAMGLCRRIWALRDNAEPTIRKALGLSAADSNRIFIEGDLKGNWCQTSPEFVASQLEALS